MCLRVCTHTSRAPGGSLNVCIRLLASSGIWGCSPMPDGISARERVCVYPGSLSPAAVGTWRCSQPTAFARLPYLHGARGSRWEPLCPPWGHGDERWGGVRPLQVGKGWQEDGSHPRMCCPPCHRLREARPELAGGCAPQPSPSVMESQACMPGKSPSGGNHPRWSAALPARRCGRGGVWLQIFTEQFAFNYRSRKDWEDFPSGFLSTEANLSELQPRKHLISGK